MNDFVKTFIGQVTSVSQADCGLTSEYLGVRKQKAFLLRRQRVGFGVRECDNRQGSPLALKRKFTYFALLLYIRL